MGLFSDFLEQVGTDAAQGAFVIFRQCIAFDFDFVVAYGADKLLHASSSLLFKQFSHFPVKVNWQP